MDRTPAHAVLGLLVDDNADTRFIVVEELAEVGIACDSYASAADLRVALARAPARRYAFALLDLQLPGADGFRVLEILRQTPQGASTPLIAYTASAIPQTLAAIRAAGFDGCVSKAVHPTQLVQAIQQVCAGVAVWMVGTASAPVPTQPPVPLAADAYWQDHAHQLVETMCMHLPATAVLGVLHLHAIRRIAHDLAGSSGQRGHGALCQAAMQLEAAAVAALATPGAAAASDQVRAALAQLAAVVAGDAA